MYFQIGANLDQVVPKSDTRAGKHRLENLCSCPTDSLRQMGSFHLFSFFLKNKSKKNRKQTEKGGHLCNVISWELIEQLVQIM